MFMIFAYGSLKRPAMSEEKTPVKAVSECFWNEEVTYGVSVPMMPDPKLITNSITHSLHNQNCY